MGCARKNEWKDFSMGACRDVKGFATLCICDTNRCNAPILDQVAPGQHDQGGGGKDDTAGVGRKAPFPTPLHMFLKNAFFKKYPAVRPSKGMVGHVLIS